MKFSKKIFFIWVGCVALAAGLLNLLPHRGDFVFSEATIRGVLLVLGLVSFFIYRYEPSSKNKPIFLNFTLFFLSGSVVFFLGLFAGKAFLKEELYAGFYFYQYGSAVLYFSLAFSLVYVVFDTLFNDFKTVYKYLLTFAIVGGTFAYYYHPIIENPKYVYNTPEITDFRAVRASAEKLQESGKEVVTAEEVAAITNLSAWDGEKKIGTLFEAEKVKRVAELLPYLEGDRVFALLYAPLDLNAIYMSVLCVVFIFLFFGYQYKNDPPQGAYIEKIIFLFLPYCSLEIFHHFAYIKSGEYSSYVVLHELGQYLTLANLFFLLIFFSLRLRFITSVKGEFYERELVSDSEHISRWRDGFDNLIVRHFLNPETLHGRFFTPRATREKA
ncbi:MAG TPA: hypothetical protein VII11_12545 [Bacteroidota bacterium]